MVSYVTLNSSWCSDMGNTCDEGGDHHRAAERLQIVNLATGIGLIATIAYGVVDGVWIYRQRTRELTVAPYVSPTATSVIGVAGRF